MSDSLGILLSSHNCPTDVFALRHLIKESGLTLETTLVSNRGFHNTNAGSFSLFEMVSGELNSRAETIDISPGDFFFGHFTTVNANNQLAADQDPRKGSLMIEALAWDVKNSLFNFYELRGNGKQGQWYYRGNSADIMADNKLLHRQPDTQHPQFGTRLRCSACHGNGGPIMKELYPPHNDWWEPNRKLYFGRDIHESLKEMLKTLVPAHRLANRVKQGIKKLAANNQQMNEVSLPELLRPLFCPVEVNFKTDHFSNDDQHADIQIPVEFFLDSRLLSSGKKTIVVSRLHYDSVLKKIGSQFPETRFQDADHAWLTPVKAKSDKLMIESLIKRKFIDRKFLSDVLAVDMFNPVFSSARCRLLKLLPSKITADWQQVFINNLTHSQEILAKELAQNLTDPNRRLEFYQHKGDKFLSQCKIKLTHAENVEKILRLLLQRRVEIDASEISSNPKGKILEPGFRVIFPDTVIVSLPEKLKLTSECDIIES